MFTAPWLLTFTQVFSVQLTQATTAVVDPLHPLDDGLGHGALLAVPQETVTESINISL